METITRQNTVCYESYPETLYHEKMSLQLVPILEQEIEYTNLHLSINYQLYIMISTFLN